MISKHTSRWLGTLLIAGALMGCSNSEAPDELEEGADEGALTETEAPLLHYSFRIAYEDYDNYLSLIRALPEFASADFDPGVWRGAGVYDTKARSATLWGARCGGDVGGTKRCEVNWVARGGDPSFGGKVARLLYDGLDAPVEGDATRKTKTFVVASKVYGPSYQLSCARASGGSTRCTWSRFFASKWTRDLPSTPATMPARRFAELFE